MYKTKDISVSKVKGYEFILELDGDLMPEHLKALGLTEQTGYVAKLEGSFSVDWDDDIAMPQIESLWLCHPADSKLDIELDLDSKDSPVDVYGIQDLLAECDSGDWYSDRLSSLADSYDRYEDR